MKNVIHLMHLGGKYLWNVHIQSTSFMNRTAWGKKWQGSILPDPEKKKNHQTSFVVLIGLIGRFIGSWVPVWWLWKELMLEMCLFPFPICMFFLAYKLLWFYIHWSWAIFYLFCMSVLCVCRCTCVHRYTYTCVLVYVEAVGQLWLPFPRYSLHCFLS